MAERGTNFYYPPDFDPNKHGSANGYQGVHHLRERARKIGQGIIIVRFEMPYNIWCEGCNNHIGMGVRYNAEKSRTGKYYTTIIYKFRMKCHLCDNYFEIQTDPANLDYTILSGARRQERRWNADSTEQIEAEESDQVKKRATDAMFKLEHTVNDKAKLEKAIPILERIHSSNERMKDDYTTNQLLRKKFREKKKSIALESKLDDQLLIKSSLNIPLVKESEKDIKLAKLLRLQVASSGEEDRQKRRQVILQQSIFPSPRRSTRSSATVCDGMQRAIGSTRCLSTQASKMVRTPIPLFGLEGKYTMALFSAASKQQQLDSVEKDLKKLHETIERDTKFREFLVNPLINATQKKDIIKSVQPKLGISDLTVSLLNVMTECGRLKLLSSVAKSYIKVMQVTRGELEVTVVTSSPVTDEATRKEIEGALKGFSDKKFLISYRVDPSIRGGLIVDFGGENYVDLSLRSKLKTYSDVLKQGV